MTASEQQKPRGGAASEPARHEPKLVMDSVGLCYSQGGVIPSRRTMPWAIRDVSLTLERGETLGVIGYNGAGKSSLLRLIAGIIEPDRGTINRFGNSAALLSFGAGFEPRLTGRQNIMLSGLQLGMPRGLIRDHTERIIELADIGEHIDRPVRAYSTGMRARLGFAIAYFVETDILLIDEVLATGDEAFRAKASELIMQRIDSDLSVVIVSHAMPMILRLCTRVVQIENGVSLPEISPEESVQRYRSVRLGQPA